MDKKRGILLSLIFVVILLFLIINNLSLLKKDSILIKGLDEKVTLNIDFITNGSSFIDSQGQQIRLEDISTVFTIEGYYKGNYFKKEFSDEEDNVLMRIDTSMTPGDGIIEGFILEKIENDVPIAYIFLDEDWKEQVGNTNIYWGDSWAFNKSFEFNSIQEGIYMEKIEDDKSRFSEDYKIRLYGIIVGDLTFEDNENKTLIKLV